MRREYTLKARAIVFVVPLAILAIAVVGGHVLVWRIFSLSVLLLLVGHLWVRWGIRGIDGEVSPHAELCQVRGSFDEEAIIRSSSPWLKLLLRIREESDLPGHANELVVNLPARGSYQWLTKVHCSSRGRYRIGPLAVEVSDPFGLFSARREVGQSRSLLVYPETVELPFFWISSYGRSGSGRNYWLTNELTGIVSRVREYASGDSLSRIHWRSTARVGKLIVKDFDIDLSQNVWLVLDMGRRWLAGEGRETTEEYCVTVAASLLKKYSEGGWRVGLMAQGEDFYFLPPRGGHQQVWRVMEALALARAGGKVPVERLISQEGDRFRTNSVVVVITPSAGDAVAASLVSLYGRGTGVAAVLVDGSSFGGEGEPGAIARHLGSSGIPAYVVKRGDSLATVLDSRGMAFAEERQTRVY